MYMRGPASPDVISGRNLCLSASASHFCESSYKSVHDGKEAASSIAAILDLGAVYIGTACLSRISRALPLEMDSRQRRAKQELVQHPGIARIPNVEHA